MTLIPGSIILSSPALDGDYFARTAILLVKIGTDGIVGFVLNKPFYRNLNDLSEFASVSAIRLYEGGPVDHEHLFFIHTKPELLGGSRVKGGIYFGGDFQRAVRLFQEGQLSPEDLKVFIGYSGWDQGQLDAEIAGGDWQMMVAEQQVLFSGKDTLWDDLFRQFAN